MPYGLPNETPEMTQKMESCVTKVMKDGKDKTTAIKICKASMMESMDMAERAAIDLQSLSFEENEDGSAKSEIRILPVGKWNHPSYGELNLTEDDIKQFEENFNKRLRAGGVLPIDIEHESKSPAAGWIEKVVNKGKSGLFAIVDWTKHGRELIRGKAYRFFSPEIKFEYVDPETGEAYKNVLLGGGLTNRPYFKALNDPLKASEHEVKQSNNEEKHMAEKDKKEEQTFSLSEFKAVEAKVATEMKLREEAEKKFAELQKTVKKSEAEQYVSGLLFSEETKQGHILPKAKDSVVAFMMSLTDEQAKKFKEIVSEGLPKVDGKMFKEVGSDKSSEDVKAPEGYDKASYELSEHAKKIRKEGETFSEALLRAEKELAK